MTEPREIQDVFNIYPTADLRPGEIAESITVIGARGCAEAVTAFKKPVTVMRITEGFVARDVTDDFVRPVPEEYDESEAWTRFHTRKHSRAVPYGRRL